jgi:hypothetical protein
MSDWTFIWFAYILTWTVVCAYTLLGISKLRRAEQRLADVESRKGGAE